MWDLQKSSCLLKQQLEARLETWDISSSAIAHTCVWALEWWPWSKPVAQSAQQEETGTSKGLIVTLVFAVSSYDLAGRWKLCCCCAADELPQTLCWRDGDFKQPGEAMKLWGQDIIFQTTKALGNEDVFLFGSVTSLPQKHGMRTARPGFSCFLSAL